MSPMLQGRPETLGHGVVWDTPEFGTSKLLTEAVPHERVTDIPIERVVLPWYRQIRLVWIVKSISVVKAANEDMPWLLSNDNHRMSD